MAAAAAAVGVIEHSMLRYGQEAFSRGLLDRPAPIIAHHDPRNSVNANVLLPWEMSHPWPPARVRERTALKREHFHLTRQLKTSTSLLVKLRSNREISKISDSFLY
jgi:hypothetical protein